MSFEVAYHGRNRQAWRRRRMAGLGSSDAPAVLGLSPFAGPLDVYLDKLEGRPEQSAERRKRFEIGHRLEPVILRMYAHPEYGAQPRRRVRHARELLRSTPYPRLIATLDGEATRPDRDGPGAVEVKSYPLRAVDDPDELIPDDVYVQVQHQLLVTGWDWADVASLGWGRSVDVVTLDRDQQFIDETLLPALLKFWTDHVEARVPPAPTGDPRAAMRALNRMWPVARIGKHVELGEELIPIDRRLEKVSRAYRWLEKERRRLQALLLGEIKDAELATLPNGNQLSAKTVRRSSYTVQATSYRALRQVGRK